MQDEEGKFINKDRILIIGIILAVVIAFVVLLIPRKENNANDNVYANKIVLFGNNPYYILKNRTYEEPGYEAYDNRGNKITRMVENELMFMS